MGNNLLHGVLLLLGQLRTPLRMGEGCGQWGSASRLRRLCRSFCMQSICIRAPPLSLASFKNRANLVRQGTMSLTVRPGGFLSSSDISRESMLLEYRREVGEQQ